MLAAFAEFERDIRRDGVRAGIAQARKEGSTAGRMPEVSRIGGKRQNYTSCNNGISATGGSTGVPLPYGGRPDSVDRTTRPVQQIVQCYRVVAGITQPLRPHLFRHQMLTFLMSKGPLRRPDSAGFRARKQNEAGGLPASVAGIGR
jgi:hypothetical protein